MKEDEDPSFGAVIGTRNSSPPPLNLRRKDRMRSLLPLTILQALSLCTGFWERQLEPKLFIEEYPHQMVHVFSRSNETHASAESLRLLLVERDNVLVGGRDYLYNLSLRTLDQLGNISWPSYGGLDYACPALQAKVDPNCANYIRIAKRISRNGFLVCGTNAYSPRCREYKYSDTEGYTWKTEVDGKNLCPYNRNQSAVMLLLGNRQIAGVSAHTTPKKLPMLTGMSLRTKLNDWKYLSADAQFVAAFAVEEYAYFFMTETALEKESCGPRVASTVVRVCGNDPGGAPPHEWMWTTFQKARLCCSLNGTHPLDFSHIQSISPVLTRWNDAFVLYAAFNVRDSPFEASAVCAFSIEDIDRSFRDGKSNQSGCSGKSPVVANSSTTSTPLERYDPLSKVDVTNYLNKPVLAHVGFDYRYTSLTIDPQVRSANGKRYDVFFVGTSHGHIIKAINIGAKEVSTVVIEDIVVFPAEEPVVELKVVRRRQLMTLLATSHVEVVSVPLDNCNWTVRTCTQCVGLQDPYCVWDKATGKCRSLVDGEPPKGVIQEVLTGHSMECPDEFSKHFSNMKLPSFNDHWGADSAAKGMGHLYSAYTLGFAIAFSIMGSIVIGFGIGYWYRHYQRKDMSYFNYR
ncbi:semaphorin-1A [Ixodes scapularis]